MSQQRVADACAGPEREAPTANGLAAPAAGCLRRAAMATLVLGLGNELLGDDGVGVRLAREMKASLSHIDDLRVEMDGHIGGLDLAERLVGYDRAVLIDAVEPGWRPMGPQPAPEPDGRPAGPRWHHWTADALPPSVARTGAHHVNLGTAIALMRGLKLPVPRDADIHLLAIEAVVHLEFHEGLSPELERDYAALRAAIETEVRAIAGA